MYFVKLSFFGGLDSSEAFQNGMGWKSLEI